MNTDAKIERRSRQPTKPKSRSALIWLTLRHLFRFDRTIF